MTANFEYRTKFVETVKRLPRDEYGRISHADFDRLQRQAKADFKAGVISDLDHFNVGCVIGEAVNGGRYHAPERSETYHA